MVRDHRFNAHRCKPSEPNGPSHSLSLDNKGLKRQNLAKFAKEKLRDATSPPSNELESYYLGEYFKI